MPAVGVYLMPVRAYRVLSCYQVLEVIDCTKLLKPGMKCLRLKRWGLTTSASRSTTAIAVKVTTFASPALSAPLVMAREAWKNSLFFPNSPRNYGE